MSPSLIVALSLMVLGVASAMVSAASAALSLESPYSVLLANLTAEAERCSKVSGFQFRNNTSPNAQQLARMCADPNCIAVTNKLFLPDNQNQTIYSRAFTAFTVPVVNYCWFLREPGLQCSTDKIGDFLSHVQDRDTTCARFTGYSYVNRTIKTWKTPTSKCPSDCYPLAIRLYYLFTYMPCAMGETKFTIEDSLHAQSTIAFCQPAREDTRYQNPKQFVYTPGWPLPPTPTTPAPVEMRPVGSSVPSSGSSVSSSGSKDTDVSPEVEFSVEEELSPPLKTLPTPRSSQPTPSPKPSSTSSPPSRGEEQEEELISTGPFPTKKAQGAVTTSTSQGEPELKTRVPSATSVPDLITSTKPSHGHLVTLLGASTGVVVLVIVLFFGRRRRKGSSSDDCDDDFTTMTSPSTTNNTRPTDDWPSNDAKMGLATIIKVIPVKHIQDISIIGAGGYGVVFLVRDTFNNRLLASKRLVDRNDLTKARIDAFIQEIQLVSTLQHPCIVTCIGATWTNRTDVQALFEYIDGGDLRTYLDTTPLPAPHGWTSEKLSIAIDIADALDYVHSARDRNTPLVHRDLKSRNVLLSKSPRRAKLSDFGLSRELSVNMSMTDGVGTSRWLAPEVILGGGDYGTACDVYSFGVVLSELDTHKLPFWDCGGGGGGDEPEGMDSVLPEIAILRMVALEGRQPSFSASCPYEFLELARQCLSYKPADRPTAATIARTLRELLC